MRIWTVATTDTLRPATVMPPDAGALPRFKPSFPLVDAKLHPPMAGSRRDDPPRSALPAPDGRASAVGRGGRRAAGLRQDARARGVVRGVSGPWRGCRSTISITSERLPDLRGRRDGPDTANRSLLARPSWRPGPGSSPRRCPGWPSSCTGWGGRPLVLDDVHRLVDRACLDALTALVDHLPPGYPGRAGGAGQAGAAAGEVPGGARAASRSGEMTSASTSTRRPRSPLRPDAR